VDDDTLYRMMRQCDLDGNGEEVDYSQFAELVGSPAGAYTRPLFSST
jgi:hypothetical protein